MVIQIKKRLAELKQVIKFIERTLPKTDVVVIEDYGKGMIVPELLTAVIKTAKALGKPILVDPKERHFDYYLFSYNI